MNETIDGGGYIGLFDFSPSPNIANRYITNPCLELHIAPPIEKTEQEKIIDRLNLKFSKK